MPSPHRLISGLGIVPVCETSIVQHDGLGLQIVPDTVVDVLVSKMCFQGRCAREPVRFGVPADFFCTSSAES